MKKKSKTVVGALNVGPYGVGGVEWPPSTSLSPFYNQPIHVCGEYVAWKEWDGRRWVKRIAYFDRAPSRIRKLCEMRAKK